MELKDKVISYIDKESSRLIEAADQIWALAEIAFDCPKSSQVLIDLLEDSGFSIEKNPADVPNSFVARFGHGKPVIGISAEYDALPDMAQTADSPVKDSVNGGNGHGCGHNAIGTGAVGAALGLAHYLSENNKTGQVVVFGCPAEEVGSGKAYLAGRGVYDEADVVLTWHPMDKTANWGQSVLANNQFFVTFEGTAAHAAQAPELGRSALDAAELMNVGVQFLREHVPQTARIHYAFLDAGGIAANIVPARSKMIYYIRATEMETCTQITDRVMNIARGAALMTDTKVSFEWDSAAFNILVNQTLVRAMYENLESLFPLPYRPEDYAYMKPFQETLSDEAKAKSRRSFEENFPKEDRIALERMATSSINDRLFPLHFSDDPIYISTDVGDVSWVCPVGQISVAYGPNGSPLHSWQWVATGKSHVAHVALLTAAKTIALTGIDLIEEPNLLAQVKAEHQLNLNGRTYHSPNPKVYAGWE